jgi:hypothetical protein
MTQPLRLSQFVVTFGPGAILEGPNGPRVIPLPDLGLFNGGNPAVTTASLEVSDQRMSQGLLRGARIFRLPSNAEAGVREGWYLYRTRSFPSWSLCLNTAGHGGRFAVLYQVQACPVCGQFGQRRQQAIRFVRACAEGHLDDVDWPHVIHRTGSTCTQSQYFRWTGIGGALAQIQLQCPQCGDREQLGNAYGREWFCSGRLPEREAPADRPRRPGGCAEAARIVQRQASNLRLPDLRTLFTIPPRATRLHNLLQSMAVRVAITTLARAGPITEAVFRATLQELANQNMIPGATLNEILNHQWMDIQQAISDVLAPVPNEFQDLLQEEFGALMTASLHGAPPVHGPAPTSRVLFEVRQSDVQRIVGPNGRYLRITPVSRLRTVTVQVGYRREVPRRVGNAPPTPVSVHFTDATNQRWYPGVEYLGEGVFITLEEPFNWHFPLQGTAAPLWSAIKDGRVQADYADYLFRTAARDELHPVFVWWHTLSHLLLRSVSIDAGYSASSIRERVFLELDNQAGRARGGVILYATQPGSEGTMGGLIALVPHFQRILNTAIEMARSCSNDPLCLEQHFAPGEHNGPSCYGCSLVSETSCEHRNLWLDRELLLGNLP